MTDQQAKRSTTKGLRLSTVANVTVMSMRALLSDIGPGLTNHSIIRDRLEKIHDGLVKGTGQMAWQDLWANSDGDPDMTQ